MGGSNLSQAFPKYLICLHFIRISTVNDKFHASDCKILVVIIIDGDNPRASVPLNDGLYSLSPTG